MSVRLSEHLPLLATAPDGIKKLRGLILELAVRGKLVPQDPNDEPASELLNRITAEKARLVAEGTCKKSKPMPPVGEDEQPFEVPGGWEWVRWNDVAQKIGDIDHKMPDTVKDGLPYVSPRDFYPDNRIDFEGAKRVSRDDFLRLSAKIRPEVDDIIYPRYGTIGENRLVVDDLEFLASYSCCVIKTLYGFVAPKFQFYFSISQCCRDQAKAAENKTTQANVGIKSIQEFVLPLPPLSEQHRIVAKVDELMALCDRMEAEQADAEAAHATLVQTLLGTLTQSRDAAELAANWQRLSQHFDTLFAAEASLDPLKQTILRLAVMGKLVPQDPTDEPASELLKRIAVEKVRLVAEGKIKQGKPLPPVSDDDKPFEVPVGWKWTRLAELTSILNGRAYSKHELLTSGTPVLRVGNLFTSNHWYYSDLALEDEKYCDAGDLLYSWSASFGPFIWPGPRVIYHYHIWKLGLYAETSLSKDYLYKFLVEKTQEIKASGHGVAMIHMTKEKMERVVVPIPPLSEQHRIVAKVDELMALCDSLKADLAEARARQARLATTLIESALQAA